LEEIINGGGEPELTLHMYGKEYMIIGFKNRVTFQRCHSYSTYNGCGTTAFNGSGEFYYNTLDELYNSITVDDILLKRDWDDIDDFNCDDFEYYQSHD